MINCETKGCGKKTNNKSGYCSDCRRMHCWHCESTFLAIEFNPDVKLCWECKAKPRVHAFYRQYKNKNGKFHDSIAVSPTTRRRSSSIYNKQLP